MEDIGKLLRGADFSKETDLKDRLAGQLFEVQHAGKSVPFSRLSGEQLLQVTAAKGIPESMLPNDLLDDKKDIRR
ncbi:MAG: hypothetical protein IJG52_06115 [Lachnospiraceae bacterium]|nr:hypothetical protein [Lachnospiraceae bacterium]